MRMEKAVDAKCAACEKGPSGQGGHDGLFSHSFMGGHVVLKCRQCGTCWTRRAAGDAYSWQAASGSDGSLLPLGRE